MHVIFRSLQDKYRNRAQRRGYQVEENCESLRRHFRLKEERTCIRGRNNSNRVQQKQRYYLVQVFESKQPQNQCHQTKWYKSPPQIEQ